MKQIKTTTGISVVVLVLVKGYYALFHNRSGCRFRSF